MMNVRRWYIETPLTVVLLVGMGALAVAEDTSEPQSAPVAKASKTEAATFSIDPVHSMALFRVRHGVSMFWGRFNKVTGTITYVPDSASGLELEVTIAIDSVDSSSEKLDGHLKSEDFFYAEKYPNATFKSKTARKTSDNIYEVSGDFTMRGVTRPLTVTVEWLGTSESPRGTTCGLETSFTVKRSDFGINYGLSTGMLGDLTRITVAMEGKQSEGGAQGRGGGGRSRFLSRFDTNGDGKLQKSEVPERMKERFDELDTNGDGALDAAEAAAMRGGRRSGRSQGRSVQSNSDGTN